MRAVTGNNHAITPNHVSLALYFVSLSLDRATSETPALMQVKVKITP
jgi:hypothetical protein